MCITIGLRGRLLVYLQGFIGLISTMVHDVHNMTDDSVVPNNTTCLHCHYTPNPLLTLLHGGVFAVLTGGALLVLSIVQAKLYGLSMYHPFIVLCLCWILVFGTAVPFVLALLRLA